MSFSRPDMLLIAACAIAAIIAVSHATRPLRVSIAAVSGTRRRAREATDRIAGDDGVILVITILILPVVVAFVGLMLDGAMVLADRRELQDAADHAALAGAMQVDLDEFAQTGHWRIADGNNIPGAQTAHEAAEEVCLAYEVQCTTDVPSTNGRRTFQVTAETDTRTVFIHLITGESAVHLVANATAVMASGF